MSPPFSSPAAAWTRAEFADRIARLHRETAEAVAESRAVINQSRETVARVRAAANGDEAWFRTRAGARRL